MALNISALTPYTDESTALAKAIILDANTIKGDLVSKIFGAYGDTVKLNWTRTVPVGTNTRCASTGLGSTVLSQAIVNMCPITFPEDICLEDFKKVWTDMEMTREYMPEAFPLGIRETLTKNKMETIALELDKIIWQGDKTNGTGNLALCDGFLVNAAALTGEVIVTKVAMTSSNSVAYIDSIIAAAPAEIQAKFEIYLSPKDFQTYLLNLRAINLFNYNTQSENVTSIHHPGSIGATVHMVNGMSGVTSGTFIATSKENIVLVLAGADEMSYDEWFAKDLQMYKIISKSKLGTGFYFPELVVRSS